MAASEAYEVAPIGTRKLLVDVAKVLREYEANHRAKADEAREQMPSLATGPTFGKDESRARFQVEAADRVSKADANARLAGRIEAQLNGWEE